MRVTHDLASGGEWVQPSSSSHGSTSMRATSPRPMNDRAPTDPSRPVKKSPADEKKRSKSGTGGKRCQKKWDRGWQGQVLTTDHQTRHRRCSQPIGRWA